MVKRLSITHFGLTADEQSFVRRQLSGFNVQFETPRSPPSAPMAEAEDTMIRSLLELRAVCHPSNFHAAQTLDVAIRNYVDAARNSLRVTYWHNPEALR